MRRNAMGWKVRLLCEHLGWHRRSEYMSFDGASFHATCDRCGLKAMVDWQGNPF